MASRVFIIEPDPKTAELLTTTLSSAGYDVAAVHDGKTAIEEINMNNVPHVIIANETLPDMQNSVFLFKNLKTEPRTKNIPTLIMSNAEKLDHAFYRIDIKDSIKKPINAKQLLESVQILLKYGSRENIPVQPKIKKEVVIIIIVLVTFLCVAVMIVGVNNIPFFKK